MPPTSTPQPNPTGTTVPETATTTPVEPQPSRP
jgi:hypothetical protein